MVPGNGFDFVPGVIQNIESKFRAVDYESRNLSRPKRISTNLQGVDVTVVMVIYSRFKDLAY